MPTRRAFLRATAGVAAMAGTEVSVALTENPFPASTLLKAYRVPQTNLVVSRIAYGCGSLVSWDHEPIDAEVVSKAERLISTAYESGITLFDLADMYSFGKAEAVFGRVMRASPGLRKNIVIQSKCGIPFGPNSQQGDTYINCSREHIVQSVEQSLKRLGIENLDILLLHWPDALVEPEEVAKGFEELKNSGKVRYFGVSNHTGSQIELLRKQVDEPLVINQIQFGLTNAYLLAGGLGALWQLNGRYDPHNYTELPNTLEYCRLRNIQVQAYSPMPRELLKPSAHAAPEVQRAAHLLAEIARQKNATPPAVALAWLLRHPAGLVPIIGATNRAHIVENCAADRIDLSREEWYALFVSAAKMRS
jgi:predicted oxidoreductase